MYTSAFQANITSYSIKWENEMNIHTSCFTFSWLHNVYAPFALVPTTHNANARIPYEDNHNNNSLFTITPVEGSKLVLFKQHFYHGLLNRLEVEERFCDDQVCVVEFHLFMKDTRILLKTSTLTTLNMKPSASHTKKNTSSDTNRHDPST